MGSPVHVVLVGSAVLKAPPEEEGGLPPPAAALLGLGVVLGDGLLELVVERVERARAPTFRVAARLLRRLLRAQSKHQNTQKRAAMRNRNTSIQRRGGNILYLEVIAIVADLQLHRKKWSSVHLHLPKKRRKVKRWARREETIEQRAFGEGEVIEMLLALALFTEKSFGRKILETCGSYDYHR